MREYLILLGIAVAITVALAVVTHRPQDKHLDVIEACEQLHSFMHDGKRYYCAPWIEMAPKAEPAPAREESTHA
jgi:hypothetical protein